MPSAAEEASETICDGDREASIRLQAIDPVAMLDCLRT